MPATPTLADTHAHGLQGLLPSPAARARHSRGCTERTPTPYQAAPWRRPGRHRQPGIADRAAIQVVPAVIAGDRLVLYQLGQHASCQRAGWIVTAPLLGFRRIDSPETPGRAIEFD